MGSVSPVAATAQYCIKMGWTYQEYLDQPVELIAAISGYWEAEAKSQQKKS